MPASQKPTGGFTLGVQRWPDAALLEVTWPDGGELFFLANGDRSIGIMAFDGSDDSHREPRVYVVPRPYWWDIDVSDEDLLLLVWQMLGEQR